MLEGLRNAVAGLTVLAGNFCALCSLQCKTETEIGTEIFRDSSPGTGAIAWLKNAGADPLNEFLAVLYALQHALPHHALRAVAPYGQSPDSTSWPAAVQMGSFWARVYSGLCGNAKG